MEMLLHCKRTFLLILSLSSSSQPPSCVWLFASMCMSVFVGERDEQRRSASVGLGFWVFAYLAVKQQCKLLSAAGAKYLIVFLYHHYSSCLTAQSWQWCVERWTISIFCLFLSPPRRPSLLLCCYFEMPCFHTDDIWVHDLLPQVWCVRLQAQGCSSWKCLRARTK